MASEDEEPERDRTRRAALSPLLSFDDFRPLSSSVQVEFGARSHRGMSSRNEGQYLVIRLGRLQETVMTSLSAMEMPSRFEEFGYAMLVADGLGEEGAGSVASRIALSTLAHLALQYGKWNLRVDGEAASEIVERLEWFYGRADAAVLESGGRSPVLTGMTTALTAAISVGDDLFVAHVGHSRAYVFREGELIQLTRDHTIEQHLIDTGRPTSVERRAQDRRHILTDAVGARGDHPSVEVERFRLANGDCVLLCTNGLTDVVSDDEIAEVLALRRRSAEQCAILTELANEHGSADHITVILAQYRIPFSDPER